MKSNNSMDDFIEFNNRSKKSIKRSKTCSAISKHCENISSQNIITLPKDQSDELHEKLRLSEDVSSISIICEILIGLFDIYAMDITVIIFTIFIVYYLFD